MAKEKKQIGLSLGYIAILILGIAISGMSISVWAKPYTSAYDTAKSIFKSITDTTQTLVITDEAKNAFADLYQVDTLAINAAFLQKMREKGELLSSDEFASRITDYYNTLVAVLTALFVLFTIVTYITIRSKFEGKFEEKAKEFESKAKDLEDKQRQKIIDELRSMLSDSKKINEVITSAVGGHIEDKIVTKEEVDGLITDIEIIGKKIVSLTKSLDDVRKKQQELYKVVDDLQEQVSEKESVYPEKTSIVVEEGLESVEASIDKGTDSEPNYKE